MKLSEHIQIARKSFLHLLSLSREYTICLILHAVLTAAVPYAPIVFSARLVDALFEGAPLEVLILYVSLTVGIVFLLKLLDTYISARKTIISADAMYRNQEWKYSEKAMQMAYESIEDRDVALLRERIRIESQTGYNLFSLFHCTDSLIHNITQVILSVSLTMSFFLLEAIHPYTKFGVAGGMLLVVLCRIGIVKKTEGLNNAFFEGCVDLNVISNKYYDYVGDYGSGKDIRIYNMADGLVSYMGDVFSGLCQREKEKDIKIAWIGLVDVAMNYLLRFGIYMVLLAAVLAGNISVGAIARYVSCVMLLLSAVSKVVSDGQTALLNHKYLKRYFSYFEIPNHMYQGSLTVEKRDDNDYNVEFRNVSFRYPHMENYALRNVNLKFKVGEKLALVGINGSGKTTFIKLMCRLYDPTEGVILLNGVDIRKYDYDEYMSVFSVVFQDFGLFSFGLGQNVAADFVYDGQRVRRCLEQAGFGDRLNAMPEGLETCLYRNFDKKGVEISGGEAQKIALARALYKDAPFLILDEPTAALDPVAEYEIYSKFNVIAGDKTAIFISHRLASCRFCDKIVVFDGGRIVQTGGHDELLSQKDGKYHELWYAQARHYTS